MADEQGKKHDGGKPRLDLIPPEVIIALGEVLSYGADKYGDRNWEKGFKWGRLFAAIQRHLWAFWSGQDLDPESGLPHLYHALAGITFLITHTKRGLGRDDRKEPAADN